MSSATPTPPPAGQPGGDLVYPPQPPKDPVVILVLNLLLFGCVGYFVIGQKTKGIVAAIAWVLGLATCGIVSGLVQVFAGIDGYLQSQQHQQGYSLGQWTFFSDHR